MQDQDKNSNEFNKIKLVFDVPDAPTQAVATGAPPRPAARQRETMPRQKGFSQSSVWLAFRSFAIRVSERVLKNKKLILAAVGVVIVGAVVVFFVSKKSDRPITTESQPPQADNSSTPPEPPLPDEWLVKYFGTKDCDKNICGANIDIEADGLKNHQELEYATDPKNFDSDFDGITDGDEIFVYDSDPVVADTDGDGFEDGNELRNGYSPTLASSAKLSALEKQVFEDNAADHGLAKQTKIFLNLESYRTNFATATTGSSEQISLSIPDGWLVTKTQALDLIEQEDKRLKVAVTLLPYNPATQADLETFWKTVTSFPNDSGRDLGSTALRIGALHLRVNEYLNFADQSISLVHTHGIRAAFLKNGRIFDVAVFGDDERWAEFSDLARVILNSIR
ncbi:MAG: hypothetical protein HY397_01950 [Candidatus Doudnabacteria bacterium]|nr:hypothetical protein [Candidatus Doudnabacteria bacterium]